MQLISNSEWAEFKGLMRDAHDTFHQKEIFWVRPGSNLDRWGEDTSDNASVVIPLKVLCNYNYMRTWPITFRTESGELDRQSVQILINKDYLREQGFIAAQGYFIYDPAIDIFIIDGIVHRPAGDTPVSQAYDDDILFSIILKREELATGQERV